MSTSTSVVHVDDECAVVMARIHRNGHVAVVLRERSGFFQGREQSAEDGSTGQWIGDIDTVHLAQSVADALAHVGCNGRGCGPWTQAS
jgi:hypothetical protein